MEKKTELDKLDIDKIIEEIKEEDIEEQSIEKKSEPKKEESKKDSDKKPKKDKKKLIFFILWIFIFVIIILMGILTYKEMNKKIFVKSGYYKINPEVIYLSKEKQQQAIIEKTYETYNFNLEIAYEFNGVYTKKILACQVACNFKSKYKIDLNKLYAYIKNEIFKKFKKLTANRFLEEIPNYNSKVSLIIENTILNSIVKFCPDVNKNKLKQTLNFVIFRIV